MTRMPRPALFVMTLMLVAPLAAAPHKPSTKPAPAPAVAAEAKLIQSCDAHKFETVVDTVVDGQSHKSKVRLCGVEGQSNAEWIDTLRDAVRKLNADKEMAPAKRDQIVAAIKAEIGRLSVIGGPAPSTRTVQEPSAAPLTRDYATLPPLPPAPETTVAPAPAAPIAAPAAPVAAPAGPVAAPVAEPSAPAVTERMPTAPASPVVAVPKL